MNLLMRMGDVGNAGKDRASATNYQSLVFTAPDAGFFYTTNPATAGFQSGSFTRCQFKIKKPLKTSGLFNYSLELPLFALRTLFHSPQLPGGTKSTTRQTWRI
jgi:hypothetical protein